MKLYINNEEAVLGNTYPDFRGDMQKLLRIVPPHKAGSTGRVYVEDAKGGQKAEYFPGVIGGEWR